MNVISLDRWRYYCFLDEQNENVLRRWFAEHDVAEPDKVALGSLLDIYEHNGPRGIAAVTFDLGGGFFALLSQRRGGIFPCPVFCNGPFYEDEITFLVGAHWNQKLKRPEPRYAASVAEERLEILRGDPRRRRLERFT